MSKTSKSVTATVSLSSEFTKAMQAFVTAAVGKQAKVKALAAIVSKEIDTIDKLKAFRTAIREMAKAKGLSAWAQANRTIEENAERHFQWVNPDPRYQSKNDGSDKRRKKPLEETTVASQLRQALSKACLELSDSELLSLISKENRVKSTIPIEVRARFNKHLMKVLDGK